MRYFEDVEVGESDTFGTATLSEGEIVSFARKWDPQPFHVDPDAAADSVHGGIIASGWHTVVVATRAWVEGFLLDVANVGSRGLSELSWHEPVRPGDTLTVSGEVLGKERADHTDEYGYLDYELRAENGDGERVLTAVCDLVVERRK